MYGEGTGERGGEKERKFETLDNEKIKGRDKGNDEQALRCGLKSVKVVLPTIIDRGGCGGDLCH